jgi:DNA-binding winged helix-turn-helix (wHTH) protein
MQTANGRTYEIGEYRLDSAAHLLCRASDGSPIPLTPRVYDTLLFLVEHAGELLDKRRLMQAIWPNLVVEENNLDQNISTLRHVFGERRGENRYIVTVRGRGYRFVAPVRVAEPAAKDRELVPAVLADPSPSAAEQAPPPDVCDCRRGRGRSRGGRSSGGGRRALARRGYAKLRP